MNTDTFISLTAPQKTGEPKRALVLPGGGLRLSYQAGILVALEEAGMAFQFMDGTSGGSLNLSMLLSGISPEEISRRWRTLRMMDTISFLPLEDYLKAENLQGMGDADGFRNKVLPHFGINFATIHQVNTVSANYNVLDYANKTVKTISHRNIDEDMVIAGMSLPGVFPPVYKDEGIYLDTGFVQDANLIEAVKNAAEEIWVLWGLGNTGVYRGGVLHLYVQMLEVSANTALNNQLELIRQLNYRIEKGDSPYGQTRPIQVHVIRPDYPLPLDPDLYLGKINHATLIEMGYADGKTYLQNLTKVPTHTIPNNPSRMKNPVPGIRFSQQLQGRLNFQEQTPFTSEELKLSLTVHINNLNAFIDDSLHSSRVTGHLESPTLGPCRMLTHGNFTLENVTKKMRRITYLFDVEKDHQNYSFLLEQVLNDDPGLDMWRDLSNMNLKLFKGQAQDGNLVANGTLHLPLKGIKDLIKSFHATEATSFTEEIAIKGRFARFFLGELYDVYH
jgi:predicted acylesterase/phospholipase RssA